MIKEMPFYPRFELPLRSRVKTWTTRSKKMFSAGEQFRAFNMIFEVDAVIQLSAYIVAEHWREEGFESRDDFLETWYKIHPRKGRDLQRVYWVHIFHLFWIMQEVKEPECMAGAGY